MADFSLDKITVTAQSASEQDFHNFNYLISGVTTGTTATYTSVRTGPEPVNAIGYGSDYQTRSPELFFNIPAAAQGGDTIIHPDGEMPVSYTNYIESDIMKILFKQDGDIGRYEKGGVVIRDSNYPPPSRAQLFSDINFDQVVLSSELKILNLSMIRQHAKTFSTSIRLKVRDGCNYAAHNAVVHNLSESPPSDLLILYVKDHPHHQSTIDFDVTINFDLMPQGLPIVIMKYEESGPFWQYRMRKKGILWIA